MIIMTVTRSRRRKSLLMAILGVMLIGLLVNTSVASEKGETSGTEGKPLPRLVDVGADKCPPCKMMAPILEKLRKEYAGNIQVEFVDIWKKPWAELKYGVRMIPTQIFYDASGKELYRQSGFMGKEDILKKLKELNIAVRKADER